ncbi:hypothetical protein M5F04_14960 [Acinetobacter sp. ANC 7200]|uniref:hypothetical protein n=1 Tax=Acinetobacter amyesii TaxID=2942470 RepID=UPI0020C1726C|nr:hypothetical protein [Acinetobacter amyesii]
MNQEQDENLDALRLDIIFKIIELKKRGATCGDINTEFMNIGFDSSNTFKSLISKISKIESGDVKKTLLNAQKVINNFIYKSVAFNNKRTFFYDIPAENLLRLFNALQEENEFFDFKGRQQNFDYEIVNHDKVETGMILDGDDDFKVIYLKSGRNRIETKHPKNKEHLFADEFGEVIDVIIKVQYVMNAFDFLVFDFKNNILVLGLDLDAIFPIAETNKSQGNYARDLRKLANVQSLKPKNLRNCVANLEAEKEGSVLNHSFMTADRGFNHAGNSITTNQDIRNDEFHQDGIKGKNADFYGIKKLFPLINDEKMILTVRMTYREYTKPNAAIYSAILDEITSYNGLKSAVRKIIEHNYN